MRDGDSRVAGPFRQEVPVVERFRVLTQSLFRPKHFGVALTLLIGVLFPSVLLKDIVGYDVIDIVFFLAIAGIAIRFGLAPSLFMAVVGALAYDFFIVPPAPAFKPIRPENLATLLAFFLSAIIASRLAAQIRAETAAAQRYAATAQALYASSRRIAEITELDELVHATVQQITTMLDLKVVLLLPNEAGELVVRAESISGCRSHAPRHGESDEPASGTDFLDLRTSNGVVGQVRIVRGGSRAAGDRSSLPDDRQKTLDAILSQAAVAIERIQLGRERDAARCMVETERLRSALLTSLSHDLKTPLASILGAITALRQHPELYDETARDDLESMIQDGAERLGRFVNNLLSMTRLEAGAIIPNRQPVDLGEVIGTSLKAAAPLLDRHAVKVDLAPDMPMLDLDAGLVEHVLVNLLDNASKYAPEGTTITVRAWQVPDGVALEVADEGPGLPPGCTERVFEKFHRGWTDTRPVDGTGLGLAICRGFIAVLGGTIWASNRNDGSGAVFRIVFPRALVSAVQADAQ